MTKIYYETIKNRPDVKVYVALALTDLREATTSFSEYLNNIGCCNLTVCPECHVDDFTHVDTCGLGMAIQNGESGNEKKHS